MSVGCCPCAVIVAVDGDYVELVGEAFDEAVGTTLTLRCVSASIVAVACLETAYMTGVGGRDNVNSIHLMDVVLERTWDVRKDLDEANGLMQVSSSEVHTLT